MVSSGALTSAVRSRSSVDFGQRPMLVFWETTRACLLACRHCRASATARALPGELSTAEGRALIDQVAGFGRPYPILVLTGGDCLLRPDLFDLVSYAVSIGVPVCLSPSVTPLLTADMIDRIAKTPQRVQGPIGAFATSPPEAKIAANLPNIARLFASDRLEDVLSALQADGSDWALSELATLRTKSPLSCKVSLRLLAEGARRTSFAEEMTAEYALAGRVVRTHDFREGVRALLIDKTGNPQWDPATPEGVTDDMLDVLFAPLPESEAWTPFPETESEPV